MTIQEEVVHKAIRCTNEPLFTDLCIYLHKVKCKLFNKVQYLQKHVDVMGRELPP